MMTDTRVIEALLLRWTDSHKGRTVTFQLPDDDGEHPFRGLKCGATNGQRLALSVALIGDDETQTDLSPTDEKQLEAVGRCTEAEQKALEHTVEIVARLEPEAMQHNQIATDDESQEAMQPSATDSIQSKGGYARAAALSPDRRSEIARDAANARWQGPKITEAAEKQGQTSAKTGRSSLGTARSQECGRFCNDAEFQDFLRDTHTNKWTTGPAGSFADIAADVVRQLCKIQSRRELDTDDGAWQRWCELMSEYACWTDAQKRKAADPDRWREAQG